MSWGLEEGILPHSRSLTDPEELAEEIRLAYVGMTRAQKRLYLVYARQRTIYGSFKIGILSGALPWMSVVIGIIVGGGFLGAQVWLSRGLAKSGPVVCRKYDRAV
jgi:DNA helicase-2/ATP-dependent DNA helicase PcrA